MHLDRFEQIKFAVLERKGDLDHPASPRKALRPDEGSRRSRVSGISFTDHVGIKTRTKGTGNPRR